MAERLTAIGDGVNLAQKYAAKVDERFKLKSLTEPFVNHEYTWEGVKTLNVYTMEVVDLTDYGTSNGNMSRYGTPADLQDTVQTMTVSQDKAFTFIIDKGDNMDSMNVRGAGKALQREIDEVIVPTKDKYRLHKIAYAAAENGHFGNGSIDKTNAYAKFLEGQKTLDNLKVPITGRVAAISASFYAAIKQDSTFVKSGDLSQKMLANGQVGEIDGVKLIRVPDSYLPTDCWFVITHPSVTVAAEKLADYKIHDNPVGVNGNVVEGRIYYDAFVLDAKKDGAYAHFTSGSLGA